MKSQSPKACASWLARRRIRKHFAGSITPAAERNMREHLSGCSGCRDYYAAHLRLSELDPQSMAAFERLGRGLGLVPQGDLSSRLPMLLAITAAGALLLVLGASRFPSWRGTAPVSEPAAAPAEFAARGTTPETDEASVLVYRNPFGQSERVSNHIARGDELSFAYTNRRGWQYLLLLGVDERGKVFWYYPAWNDAATTPSALPIRASATLVELPDAIRHQLTGKHLRLLSIFANRPLSVREVEERLSSLGASHEGQLFHGTLERELALEVR